VCWFVPLCVCVRQARPLLAPCTVLGAAVQALTTHDNEKHLAHCPFKPPNPTRLSQVHSLPFPLPSLPSLLPVDQVPAATQKMYASASTTMTGAALLPCNPTHSTVVIAASTATTARRQLECQITAVISIQLTTVPVGTRFASYVDWLWKDLVISNIVVRSPNRFEMNRNDRFLNDVGLKDCVLIILCTVDLVVDPGTAAR